MTRRAKTSHVVFWLLVLVSTPVLACKLPVFRYALERWQVDRYRMVAIIDEPLTEDVRRSLVELSGEANANVDVEIVDLSAITEEERWLIEDLGDESAKKPLLQVFYPERNGTRTKCWEGALTAEAVLSWQTSTLRQQIADDIVRGVSVVWVMLDGKDEKENRRVAEMVASALQHAESTITIPDGVIPREGASQYLRDHDDASMDDVLRSDIPLNVDFEFHRLARQNETEGPFRAMIDGLANSRSTADGQLPVLVPIFGRGRMLDAILGDSVSRQTILNACQYMVGECSCTVKAQNPGVDLILSVNWQSQLGESVLVVSEVDVPVQASEPTLVAIPTGRTNPVQDVPRSSKWAWPLFSLVAVLIAYGLHRSRRQVS